MTPSFSHKLKNYMTERYSKEYANQVFKYLSWIKENNIQIAESAYGFITFELKGDAVIIYDMYIEPKIRRLSKGWDLFKGVQQQAKKANKQVMITFSEKIGKNQELGIAAIKAANFIKAFETDIDTVYIRGAE